MQLRTYQAEAIEALQAAIADGETRPLVQAPTGAGKSVILSETISQWMTACPHRRFLVLTHTKELVQQDYDAIVRSIGSENVGIYSAGLSRRDTRQRVIVGGIQSVARHAGSLGTRDVVIIDEAHRLPRSGWGQYRSVLHSEEYPLGMEYLIGLTATPYRLDGGMLCGGEDAPFGRVVYEIPIRRLVDEGYLSPLRPLGSDEAFRTDDLKVNGGEFVADARFEERVADIELLEQIVDGWTKRAKRPDGSLRPTLVFCASIRQLGIVEGMIAERGISCASVTGATPDGDVDPDLLGEATGRTAIIQAFKAGKLTALLNCNVLTTGFDAPNVECILSLRPTASPGLYVQMMGRGTRLARGKTDCLVLDHAGNVERHGPIDRVNVPRNGKGATKQEPKAVRCKGCETMYSPLEDACPFCGLVRQKIVRKLPTLTGNPAADDLIDRGLAKTRPVVGTIFGRHTAASGRDCVRITHQFSASAKVSEFLAFDSDKPYAVMMAQRTWLERFPRCTPAPSSTSEALEALAEAPPDVWPSAVVVQRDDSGWDRVVCWIHGERKNDLFVASDPVAAPSFGPSGFSIKAPAAQVIGPDTSWMKNTKLWDDLEAPF